MLDDRFRHGAGEGTEQLVLFFYKGSVTPKIPENGNIMYASEDQIWARISIFSHVPVRERHRRSSWVISSLAKAPPLPKFQPYSGIMAHVPVSSLSNPRKCLSSPSLCDFPILRGF